MLGCLSLSTFHIDSHRDSMELFLSSSYHILLLFRRNCCILLSIILISNYNIFGDWCGHSLWKCSLCCIIVSLPFCCGQNALSSILFHLPKTIPYSLHAFHWTCCKSSRITLQLHVLDPLSITQILHNPKLYLHLLKIPYFDISIYLFIYL